jgi:hypothetical protein
MNNEPENEPLPKRQKKQVIDGELEEFLLDADDEEFDPQKSVMLLIILVFNLISSCFKRNH